MSTFEIPREFVTVEKEDDLTKAVFGCLELLSPDALNEIVKQTPVDIWFESEPKFTFHETVDRREPDVIIEDGQDLTVMVEAKLGAPTDTSQLSDEYADLIAGWDADVLRLLHVTDDSREPPEIAAQTDIPPDRLLWLSWRELAAALHSINGIAVNETDRRVIGMLTQIFEDNGFAPFNGFTLMKDSQTLSEQLHQAYQVRDQYYDEINSFRKDAERYLNDEVEFWRFFRRGVSGGMGSGTTRFPTKRYQRMPKHLWFSYIPRDRKPQLAERRYLQNYLALDFNSKTGAIRAGYIVTTAPGKVQNDHFRKTLHQHKDTVVDIIREHGLDPYTTSYSLSSRIDSMEGIDSFLDEIRDPDYELSEWGKRFMIAKTLPAEELPTRKEDGEGFEPAEVTNEIAGWLNEIHEITYRDYDHIFYPVEEQPM